MSNRAHDPSLASRISYQRGDRRRGSQNEDLGFLSAIPQEHPREEGCDWNRAGAGSSAARGLAVDERALRVAENEVLFRQVNEHVVAGGRRPGESFEILCECADTGCMDHVPVTTEAYERARNQPTDFLLKPGHAKREFETVIESHEAFVLVRKTGEAAVHARSADPAHRPG